MKTTDQTTTIQTPYAAIRLAEQLGMSVEKLVQKTLELGLREVDWNLSEGCDALAHGCIQDEIDITKAMDKLPVDRFRRMLDSDTPPQEVLKQKAYDRRWRGLDREKHARKLALLTTPEGEEEQQEEVVIKLRCKPTLVS